MGLGKSDKGGKLCGGDLGAVVGPQRGPGAKPLAGVWGQRPQKLKVFFSMSSQKKHSGAWKSDICKSASVMFRPGIYLVILKIALKISFLCSKNKILAKVPNHLTATVRSSPKVVQQRNIFWYRYSILFNLSATTKGKPLCVKVEKNRPRHFSTQILRIAKGKKKKKRGNI